MFKEKSKWIHTSGKGGRVGGPPGTLPNVELELKSELHPTQVHVF